MGYSKYKLAFVALALIVATSFIALGPFLWSATRLIFENLTADSASAVTWNWCPNGVSEISVDPKNAVPYIITSPDEIKNFCAARILHKIEKLPDLEFKVVLTAHNSKGLKTFVERTPDGIYRVDGMLFKSTDFDYKLNKLSMQRKFRIR